MIVEFLIAIIIKAIFYLILLISILWLLKELTMGISHCRTSLKDKIVLITGGHEGIGLEVVLALAKRQAKIIIGCQNVSNVKENILQKVPDADVEVMWLDLSSKDRILHFAKEIKSKYTKIDILINNACFIPKKTSPGGNGGRRGGAFAKGGRTKTADGFELVMGENYFGHVLLNHSILPIMKQSNQSNQTLESINEDSSDLIDDFDGTIDNGAHLSSFCSRIIVMSTPVALTSWANNLYINNHIQFEDSTKNPLIQYSKSKLAQIMYVKHLSRILQKEKSNTIITAYYPGFVHDGLHDYIPIRVKKAFNIIFKIFGKNTWQAAQTCVYLSSKDFSNDRDQANGKLFLDCRSNDWFMPNLAKNQAACQRLWNNTEEMLGLKRL